MNTLGNQARWSSFALGEKLVQWENQCLLTPDPSAYPARPPRLINSQIKIINTLERIIVAEEYCCNALDVVSWYRWVERGELCGGGRRQSAKKRPNVFFIGKQGGHLGNSKNELLPRTTSIENKSGCTIDRQE